mmetsp:Transcript_55130/g.153660  ORF Transcript_55130/g.153660 Transcript_55130/m.153660 type:complete len:302 (-) Transcript_55130:461-1366(-)
MRSFRSRRASFRFGDSLKSCDVVQEARRLAIYVRQRGIEHLEHFGAADAVDFRSLRPQCRQVPQRAETLGGTVRKVEALRQDGRGVHRCKPPRNSVGMPLDVSRTGHLFHLLIGEGARVDTEIADETERLLAALVHRVADDVELVFHEDILQRAVPCVQEKLCPGPSDLWVPRARHERQHVPPIVELRGLERVLSPSLVGERPDALALRLAIQINLRLAVAGRRLDQHVLPRGFLRQRPIEPTRDCELPGEGVLKLCITFVIGALFKGGLVALMAIGAVPILRERQELVRTSRRGVEGVFR